MPRLHGNANTHHPQPGAPGARNEKAGLRHSREHLYGGAARRRKQMARQSREARASGKCDGIGKAMPNRRAFEYLVSIGIRSACPFAFTFPFPCSSSDMPGPATKVGCAGSPTCATGIICRFIGINVQCVSTTICSRVLHCQCVKSLPIFW